VSWNDPDVLQGRDGLTLLMETLVGLYAEAAVLAEKRRAEPADDILTGLVTAEVDGERLTDEEIAAFFVLLSVAANDTTRQTISHGMRALCRFPDQRALLASDLDRYLPDAVEEIVRWTTPVMTFRRTATRDAVLNGMPINEGDKVVMFYISANRDEAVFEDPWRFDITREPQHVGFGGGGPHFCLGASLARSMLRSMFRELVTRAPTLQLGEPKFLVGNFIQGITTMPYRL
jgi:cytochrome P450